MTNKLLLDLLEDVEILEKALVNCEDKCISRANRPVGR